MSKGHYRTKKEAERHAAFLRRNFPRMKPVKVVKRDIGWDVVTSR